MGVGLPSKAVSVSVVTEIIAYDASYPGPRNIKQRASKSLTVPAQVNSDVKLSISNSRYDSLFSSGLPSGILIVLDVAFTPGIPVTTGGTIEISTKFTTDKSPSSGGKEDLCHVVSGLTPKQTLTEAKTGWGAGHVTCTKTSGKITLSNY